MANPSPTNMPTAVFMEDADSEHVQNVVIFLDMLLPESPLIFDEADRHLYAKRPDAQFWLRTAQEARGGGWLLLGVPGAGKTTLLRWFESELRDERGAVAWVDAGMVSGATDLASLIAEGLSIDPRATPMPQAGTESLRAQQCLQAMREAVRTCVLIDNLTNQEAAFDLFGRMRDLVWATGHTFIVAGRLEDVAVLRRAPADAFFSHTFTLAPPGEALLSALAENAGAAGPDLARLLKAHPSSIRAAVRHLNDPGLYASAERWRRTIAALRPALASVAEQVLELGRPVTAEDEELKARTGLGSIALRRYLRSLKKDGFLTETPEPTAGPGRPRLLYEADLHATRERGEP